MSDSFGNISISPSGSEPPSSSTAEKGNSENRFKKRILREKDRSATPGSTGRLLKVLVPCILFLSLLYALGGFWLVPRYLKKSLPAIANTRIGMHLTIEAIELNPFTFNFSLQDLQLQPSPRPDNSCPDEKNRNLLRIARIDADFAPLSLLRHDLVSNSLAIKGIEMNVVRSHDNRYNIEDLFSSRHTGVPPDIINFSKLPFLFSLNNISIKDSRITFQDIPAATTHTVEQIELNLPSLSNFPFQSDRYIRPKFSAVINGSKVELTGQTSIPSTSNGKSRETKLSCNIQGMDLPQYFNYLPVTALISLTRGKADGIFELNFTHGTKEQKAMFAVDFTGRITSIELNGKEQPLEATIPSIILEGSFSPINRLLHIRKLVLSTPRMKSRPADIAQTFIPLLPANQKNAGQPTSETRPFSITIDLLAIDDGSVDVIPDKKAKPETWSSLQINVQNYHWNSLPAVDGKSRNSFDLSVENTTSGTTLSWQGAAKNNGTLDGPFRIDNIAATTFLTTIGIPNKCIQSGKASLQGKLKVSRKDAMDMRPTIDLSETTTTLQNLKLTTGGKLWLDAPVLTLTGMSKSGSKVNLGDLRLENGKIALQSDGFPDILKVAAAKGGMIMVNSADYSGRITVTGKHSAAPLVLSSVVLQAKSLDDRQNAGDNLVFSATINDKGTIKAKGTARLSPFQATLKTEFSSLEAKTVLPWFSSLPLLTEAKTTVTGTGLLTLPEASFSGDVKFGAAVFQRVGNPLITWKQCNIKGIYYSREPFHLSVAQMDIGSPIMNWQRSPNNKHPAQQLGSFIQDLLPVEKKAPTGDKDELAMSQLDVQKITITDGRIPYCDTRISPQWSTTVQITEGAISEIHSQGANQPGRFSFTGNFNQADFTLSGSADLFGKKTGGEDSFHVIGLRLSDFAKHLPPDLGIDTSKATFSATGSISWKNSRLTENVQYVFTDLQTVSVNADAALPLAFLTNNEGKVVLNIKGEHDLTGESISAIDNILATFQRQVVKAKVSPILLAGSKFADLVGSEFAEFIPGDYELTGQGQKNLARFAALLNSHPAVGIYVIGAADKNIDGDTINRQLEDIEIQRIAQENERRRAAWEVSRETELARRKARVDKEQRFIKENLILDFPEFVPLKPAPVAFQDSMLKDLAQRRADLVRKLLVKQLSFTPSRVTIAPRLQITADNNIPGNRVLLELRALDSPNNAAGEQGRSTM